MEEHIQRYSIAYPNVMDDRGRVAIDYGVRGIPEKYFIDRSGNVVKKFVGPTEPDVLRAVLEELLESDTTPPAPHTHGARP